MCCAEVITMVSGLVALSSLHVSTVIIGGCAQTAVVGDPMQVVSLLFFLCPTFVRLLIKARVEHVGCAFSGIMMYC